MPVALTPAVRARIRKLRRQGTPPNAIAQQLGVSRSAVFKHSDPPPAAPAQAPPRPKRGPGRPPGRRYDDPRFDHPPEDEYDDVVPIPFYPADLPRLELDPFWTPARLQYATDAARRKLHNPTPLPKD